MVQPEPERSFTGSAAVAIPKLPLSGKRVGPPAEAAMDEDRWHPGAGIVDMDLAHRHPHSAHDVAPALVTVLEPHTMARSWRSARSRGHRVDPHRVCKPDSPTGRGHCRRARAQPAGEASTTSLSVGSTAMLDLRKGVSWSCRSRDEAIEELKRRRLCRRLCRRLGRRPRRQSRDRLGRLGRPRRQPRRRLRRLRRSPGR